MSDERKVVCLGMPAYGGLSIGAARGFFNPSITKKWRIELLYQDSSLLAQNMNVLWAWALNTARNDRCDYFAMLHSDIEPQQGWLDVLIEELEAKDLDVLGAIAPIKDQRGVTSTALARGNGDTWRVHARLTMAEVYRLPETFTSADVQKDLLINTGCWVCKFDERWARQVRFTVNDQICFDAERNLYHVQVEPEDWYISRLFHELGLKVGATRKVELGHRGTMIFGNHSPWGANAYDKEYLTESCLPEKDWFPHDVSGWLSETEGRALAELATGKVVCEIGSYCGKSTICLAQKARSVCAIDTFDGRGTACEGDTLPLFKANITRYGVAPRVNAHKAMSSEMFDKLPPIFDLVFIDGSHDYESVTTDIEGALKILRPGGIIAFHDYCQFDGEHEGYWNPGVTQAVNEFLGSGAKLLRRHKSLAVVQPPALEPVEV